MPGPGGTGRARWAGGGRPWSDVGRGRISSQARRGLLHGRNESSVVWSELRRRPRVTGSPAVSVLGVSVLVTVFLGSKRPEYVLPRTEQGTVWARQPARRAERSSLPVACDRDRSPALVPLPLSFVPEFT